MRSIRNYSRKRRGLRKSMRGGRNSLRRNSRKSLRRKGRKSLRRKSLRRRGRKSLMRKRRKSLRGGMNPKSEKTPLLLSESPEEECSSTPTASNSNLSPEDFGAIMNSGTWTGVDGGKKSLFRNVIQTSSTIEDYNKGIKPLSDPIKTTARFILKGLKSIDDMSLIGRDIDLFLRSKKDCNNQYVWEGWKGGDGKSTRIETLLIIKEQATAVKDKLKVVGGGGDENVLFTETGGGNTYLYSPYFKVRDNYYKILTKGTVAADDDLGRKWLTFKFISVN